MPAVCQRVGEFKEAHKYTIMYLLGTVILASSIGTNTVLLCSIGSVVLPLSLCTNSPSCIRRGGVIADLMMRRSSRSAPGDLKEILWSIRSHHQEKARSVQDLLPPVIIHMSWPQGEVGTWMSPPPFCLQDSKRQFHLSFPLKNFVRFIL